MISFPKLVARNLAYHWRGNLAVLLGVAVGSAVLTGALLVGDSLRGSLRARAEQQLNGIDAAAILPRLLPLEPDTRGPIADGLPGKTAPVLMLPASLQTAGNPTTARFLGRVTALGVDSRFKPIDAGIDWGGFENQIVLSAHVAEKLGAKAGDTVKLGAERFSDLPRWSALSKRGSADVIATRPFTVAAILPPDDPANDFKLSPDPGSPLNVYVPLEALYELVRPVNLDAKPIRSFTVSANALLSRGAGADDLNAALRTKLEPEDYGIKFVEARTHYVSVEIDRLVFPPAMVHAILASAKDINLPAEPTVIYIADSLTYEKREIPYPVVVGLNPAAPLPLGHFLPNGLSNLADGEVVLLQWNGSELNNLPDRTELTLTYYDPEVEGEGKVRTAKLTLRASAGYLTLPPTRAARDLFRFLTPQIRGVTDLRTRLDEIDLPPVLPKKETDRRLPPGHPRRTFIDSPDKATPIAYVNLATAEKLFGSRYGAVTSVRVAIPEGRTSESVKDELRKSLVKHLDPKDIGLVFQPIRERLLTASKGGTDFGGLFLGFSFFLIAAALMLVGLLFRLTLDRRAKEVGLLLASGFAVRHVRRLLLSEGLVIALVGALAGLALGVVYNRLLIAVLLELWPDKEVANVLHPHVTALSFAIGFVLTVLMSLGALWLSIRGLVKVMPPALLRGETQVARVVTNPGGRIAKWLVIAGVPLGIALVVAGKFVANPDMQAMTFFGGGGLLLTAGLAAMWVWMKRTRHSLVNGRGPAALARLGTRNAARNPSRSLLTAALLASAAFLLVAVESFRRQPGAEFLDKDGGSGGFNLIAECDVPLFESFASGPGRADLELQLRSVYSGVSLPKTPSDPQPPTTPASDAAKAELDANLEEVFALRLRAGDDASCMNLFQASRPRVLGVPQSLVARGGFKFYETEAKTPELKANPWLLLNEQVPDGAIPVFCEQNTAQWMLKTAVGGEIKMPDNQGNELTLRIVGTFADSPFQSELVMAEDRFKDAFGEAGGYRVFLVRTLPGKEDAVSRVLSLGLRANGLIAVPTRERVAAYQAVIGAYLSTFQLLGGLGLLLGVLGLAVVVLRGVWERVGELALLRAVGYRTRQLQWLVLAENALLLVAGIAIGVIAALVSVAPHIAEGAAVPWLRLAGILGIVLVAGLAVASVATAGILRVPVIPALRRE